MKVRTSRETAKASAPLHLRFGTQASLAACSPFETRILKDLPVTETRHGRPPPENEALDRSSHRSDVCFVSFRHGPLQNARSLVRCDRLKVRSWREYCRLARRKRE